MGHVSKPRRARALLPILAVAASGCINWPLTREGPAFLEPVTRDAVAVAPPPRAWAKLAVLPFGGAAPHRRPAEEWVAHRLRRETALEIISPFTLRAALAPADGASLLEVAERWDWAKIGLEQPSPDDKTWADAAALARRAGADAVVIGRVHPGGGTVDLALVDVETAVAIAIVRRAGGSWVARDGVHALAMGSTDRAVDDLVIVVKTAPGRRPPVGAMRPAPPAPPRAPDSVPGERERTP